MRHNEHLEDTSECENETENVGSKNKTISGERQPWPGDNFWLLRNCSFKLDLKGVHISKEYNRMLNINCEFVNLVDYKIMVVVFGLKFTVLLFKRVVYKGAKMMLQTFS